jgi:glycosyltransferase involved in cell wall biosynthesis
VEGVSIIICCYNSAKRLPETLAHISRQKFPVNVPWEVILVDNASADNTREVAEQASSRIPLRVVYEERRGLSSARRRGIAESNYDTLVFCDDDNWLDENYAATAFGIMRDKSIGAVGGIGTPHFETREPAWFHYMSSYYAVGEQQNNVIPEMSNRRYLYGAGMVISKEAITRLLAEGFSNVTSDRVGNTLISGGDTEISLALQQRGYRVEYSDSLKFRHYIPKDRLTIGYCSRLIIGIGYSSQMLHRKPVSLSRVIKAAIVVLIPLQRFGTFFQKWRLFLFEVGRYKFHSSGQK